ncbi:MAG: hypothetical protein OHK0053_01300 [Microscillaceae bacterium]
MNWSRKEAIHKANQYEQIRTEITLLKSQISPHFIFNTLNNIYSLASDKSEDTETAILKLSQLLRYIIYDSSADKISLSKEIEYLQNYIDLQKLRLSERHLSLIYFKIVGDCTGIVIPPLLTIPLVENAFKYGIGQGRAHIEITLHIQSPKLIFRVRNEKLNLRQDFFPEASGIGLKNLERRIQLLQNPKNQLAIYEDHHFFEALLTLDIL